MTGGPRITFGIIVLNGEPFTRYNLRALYPFAHQIIVVEGAVPAAAEIATPDGHSLDGTLEILHRFKTEEDPEDKITIVTAEDEGYPNGFWLGEKDEQSRAYAKRATGNWLWQVDIDEFYQPQDIVLICNEFLSKPHVWAVSFQQIQFWGGLQWYVDGWYLRHLGGSEVHRLFRWQPGYTYATHRPTTVLNRDGVNLRSLGWIRGDQLARQGIFLYHYSLVFPTQVQRKSTYYRQVEWGPFEQAGKWYQDAFERLKPFRVHNVYRYPSWLERYDGCHPPQIDKLWRDIEAGVVHLQVRHTEDIKRLLDSRWYMISRTIVKFVGPLICIPYRTVTASWLKLPPVVRKTIKRILGREL